MTRKDEFVLGASLMAVLITALSWITAPSTLRIFTQGLPTLSAFCIITALLYLSAAAYLPIAAHMILRIIGDDKLVRWFMVPASGGLMLTQAIRFSAAAIRPSLTAAYPGLAWIIVMAASSVMGGIYCIAIGRHALKQEAKAAKASGQQGTQSTINNKGE